MGGGEEGGGAPPRKYEAFRRGEGQDTAGNNTNQVRVRQVRYFVRVVRTVCNDATPKEYLYWARNKCLQNVMSTTQAGPAAVTNITKPVTKDNFGPSTYYKCSSPPWAHLHKNYQVLYTKSNLAV